MTKNLFFPIFFIVLTNFCPPSVSEAKLGKTIILPSVKSIEMPNLTDRKNAEADRREAHAAHEKLTVEQRQDLEHGGQNAVIYWNAIAREWVAAHNVPPHVLPDSSGYPTPNAARPADIPRYPFATPPVAARVYAYLSVGQYDALLVAKHWQIQIKNATLNTQNTIQTTPSVSENLISEEAVVAAVSADILKYFFPAETQSIDNQYQKALKQIFLTEKYDKTALALGENLGKEVARKIIEKAQSDRYTESQKNNATPNTQHTTLVWSSIQKPTRPAIEPHFGSVKMWLVDDVASVRPPAPPSPTLENLQSELDTLRRISRSVGKAENTIMVKWADAEFSYTPLGHWNLIAADLLRGGKKDNFESAQTLAYLNIALMDATIACWEAKYFYNYPRPVQVDKSMRYHLPMPNFPSYPSGHSTLSGAAAAVLAHFFPNDTQKLTDMAAEASRSRIMAALHFKMDCDAGMLLGQKLGSLAVVRFQNDKLD